MRTPRDARRGSPAARAVRLLLAASLLLPLAAAAEPASVESGFQAGKAFQVGDLDSVNIFNGNLTLAVPLGPQIPVGHDFSWGLTLIYSSEPWDFSSRVLEDGSERELAQAIPRVGNAGLGWKVRLGNLSDPPVGTPGVVFLDPVWTNYLAPDGSSHRFYRTLHNGDSNGNGDVGYSRDGTYLRLRRFADNHRELEFPDGRIHKFNGSGQLTRMTDHFGANTVDVTQTPTLWTLVDAHARRLCVALSGDLVRHVLVPSFGRWPSVSECNAAAGYTGAKYSLGYTSRDLTRAWPATETETAFGGMVATGVSMLTRVTLPDGSFYDMSGASDYSVGLPWGVDSASEGLLRRIRLATGGFLEWDWGTYQFPGLTGRPWYDNSQGVFARRTKSETGTLFGQWTYSPQITSVSPLPPTQAREMVNTVTDPLGHQTKNYFVVSRLRAVDNNVMEYGLPLSRERPASGGRFLSTEVFKKPAGGGAVVKVRSTYVRYEGDAVGGGGDFEDETNRNRRAAASRTVYHDDGGRFLDSDSSEFDGLGHYRRTLSGGNFASADQKNAWTNFNPGVGNYRLDASGNAMPGFTMLASTAPWVLGIFPESSVTEGGTTFAQRFCFDANNGFLRRKRTLLNKSLVPGLDDNDQLVVYTGSPVGNGFFVTERFYGGDKTPIATATDLCNLALPASAAYTINHTQAYGSQTSAQFAGANFFTMRRNIDWASGRPSASFDSADVKTDYLYDLLGRLVSVRPESGSDGWTEYAFVPAVGSVQSPRLIVRRYANGGQVTELARTEYRYDGLGRLSQERFRRAGQDDITSHFYDAAGNKDFDSERGAAAQHGTKYLEYDSFGRPGRVRRADLSETTVSYFGDREVVSTSKIGTHEATPGGAIVQNDSVRTERYDQHGRLYQVIEPVNPWNQAASNTLATYTYDPANHLVKVQVESAGTMQTRDFGFDGLGNLRFENHPEKTSNSYEPGVGYPLGTAVDFLEFDAMGRVGRTVDGPNELVYSYDASGRPTLLSQARGPSGNFNPTRPVKVWSYGSGATAADRSKGKVSFAQRYNYPFVDGVYYTIAMSTNYTYGGRAGRLSRRDLSMSFNGTTTESFTQQWAFNDLGQVNTLTYPRCTFSPCQNVPGQSSPRVVTSQYTDGLLTAVTGYASIAYHPNLMVSQATFADGSTWNQDMDPANGMARPATIRISGGAVLGPYLYDGSGNLNKVGTEVYLYDLGGRLSMGRMGDQTYQQYTYDGFGNILSMASNLAKFSRATPTNSVSNRLTGGFFDAAGNLTYWNGQSYDYDALNRMNRLITSGQEWHYMYDADDERVWSFRAGLPRFDRWVLRDLDGKALRTYEATDWVWTAPASDHVYRGDKLLATEWGTNGGRKNALLDHLGTPRLIRSTPSGTVVDHHYLPFGEEAAGGIDAERLKFTGHERDANNSTSTADDIDYMHARFYNPLLGRFTSLDTASGKPAAPQSWNRYSYTMNDPVNSVDPDGLSSVKAWQLGPYFAKLYPGDTFHGGPHYHLVERKGGALLARVGLDGKVLTGTAPKAAISRMTAKGLLSMQTAGTAARSAGAGATGFFGAALTGVMLFFEAAPADAMSILTPEEANAASNNHNYWAGRLFGVEESWQLTGEQTAELNEFLKRKYESEAKAARKLRNLESSSEEFFNSGCTVTQACP